MDILISGAGIAGLTTATGCAATGSSRPGGRSSATSPSQFMTQDPTSARVELSGREIESVIDRSTDRIADAANAITLKDYPAFTTESTG